MPWRGGKGLTPRGARARAAIFFAMHAIASVGDALWSSAFGKSISPISLGLPTFIQSLCVVGTFAPTIPYFASIWIQEGMFDLMSIMAPQIKYG